MFLYFICLPEYILTSSKSYRLKAIELNTQMIEPDNEMNVLWPY